MLTRILVVSPRAALAARVERLLGSGDALVDAAEAPPERWDDLDLGRADLLLVDRVGLPALTPAVLQPACALPDGPDVVVLVATEDADDRAGLLAAGCAAVLNEGLPDRALAAALRAVVARREAAARRRRAGEAAAPLEELASASPAMQRVLATARKLADADTAVLLLGETGVGKERLARALHEAGPRRAGPFVAVNCAAIPEGLVESELFGHERGAFTGAVRARRGHFELAHRGTFLLDEVGDLPLHVQVKLLRVLQERTIQPVGSERSIAVDVRVIAATHRDLQAECAAGRFRQDLYYRLGVVTLRVPPLRERPEDIAALAEGFRDRFARRLGRPVHAIAPTAMELLRAYPWPGNVRELLNVMERTVLLCAGERIEAADLPDLGPREPGPPEPTDAFLAARWLEGPWDAARDAALASLERWYLDGLLRATGGRVGEVARRSGLNPRSVYEKMRRHGLRKEAYRRRSGPQDPTAG